MKYLSAPFALFLIVQLNVAFAAEEGAIEEIIVTGSYIKRDSFDSASPLKVIDQIELQNQATPALGEVLANQTFNYGSDTFSNNYTARFQEGNATSANLRGLGAGATLNLVDGKRTSTSNLNNMVPQIAIERIDILKDGASALYGSDAVAGVVNIVTRKGFEGFEVSGFYTADGEGDHDEYVLNTIIGTQTDRGHIAFAGEYRKRTALYQLERPDYLTEGFSRSGTGNPGSWLVPNRDATGALTGTNSQLADPGCGVLDSPGGNGNANAGNPFNNLSGTRASARLCQFQFGEFFNFVNPNETLSIWSDFEHAFTDTVSYNLNLIYSRQRTADRGSPTNPGGRIGELDPILGSHPGNPYRALAPDVNGDLQPIYAVDDGSGNPLRDANGVVVLPADPFDSAQGIAFNEDVSPAALRLFGKLGTLPSNLDDTGANIGAGQYDTYNIRAANKISWDMPGSWDAEFNLNYQQNHTLIFQKNQSFDAVQLGLQGNLADVDGDGNTEWYNPFATSAMTCVDRICTDSGAQFDNKLQVADAISFIGHTVTDTDYWQIDAIFTGDLFSYGDNTVGAAFGIEWQDTQLDFDDTVDDNGCNNWINQCGFDYKARQKIFSVFGEMIFPLGSTAEIQLAARYSDYSDLGDSFDPKIAGLWQPTEWLSVRGSYSTAFIAPTLAQRFQGQTSFLQTTNDPVQGDYQSTFRSNTYEGNPDLLPEEADVYNVGLSLAFFDASLGFGVDYAQYDFKDRIARTTAPQVVEADFERFLQMFPQADPLNPNPADSLNWIQNFQDPGVGRGPGPSFTILNVQTEYLNAQKMDHKAWDFYVTYNLPTDNTGMWNFRVDATYVDSYEFDLGNGITGDAVGRQNDYIDEVPPTPELRMVGSVNWSLGGHFALARLRWSDSVVLDSAFAPQCRGEILPDSCQDLDDLLYLDLTYSYTWDSLFGEGRRTVVEVGGRNVTDELPEPIFTLAGIETFLHDPRGAMWFLRFQQEI